MEGGRETGMERDRRRGCRDKERSPQRGSGWEGEVGAEGHRVDESRAREKNERQGGREIEGRREEEKVEEGRGVGEVREEGIKGEERGEWRGRRE